MIDQSKNLDAWRYRRIQDDLREIATGNDDLDALASFRVTCDGGSVHVTLENDGRGPSLLFSRNGHLDDDMATAITNEFRQHVRRRGRERQIRGYSQPPSWSYDADELIIGIVENAGADARLLAPTPNMSRNYACLQEQMRKVRSPIGGITEQDGHIYVDTLSTAEGNILAWDDKKGPGLRITSMSLPETILATLIGRPLEAICDHRAIHRSHDAMITSAVIINTPTGGDLVLRIGRSRHPLALIPTKVDQAWMRIEC